MLTPMDNAMADLPVPPPQMWATDAGPVECVGVVRQARPPLQLGAGWSRSRPQAVQHRPDPAAHRLAITFARMIKEALAGTRPARQLQAVMRADRLEQVVSIQRMGGLTGIRCTHVRADRPAPGTVEAVACYRWISAEPPPPGGEPAERAFAVAFRLDFRRGRWCCDELQIIASAQPDRAA